MDPSKLVSSNSNLYRFITTVGLALFVLPGVLFPYCDNHFTTRNDQFQRFKIEADRDLAMWAGRIDRLNSELITNLSTLEFEDEDLQAVVRRYMEEVLEEYPDPVSTNGNLWRIVPRNTLQDRLVGSDLEMWNEVLTDWQSKIPKIAEASVELDEKRALVSYYGSQVISAQLRMWVFYIGSVVTSLAGLCCMWWGFYRWYERCQRYEDILLASQTE